MCDETKKADTKAFVRIMNYINEMDYDHSVIGMQVENEPGQLGTPRDYAPEAEEIFRQIIPEDMRAFLSSLTSGELYNAWCENGRTLDKDWKSVLGFVAEEVFSAYCFAKYIEDVAKAGKETNSLPIYVNVWVMETANRIPGIDYPSGGCHQSGA